MKLSNLLESYILIHEAREDFAANKRPEDIERAYYADTGNEKTAIEIVKEISSKLSNEARKNIVILSKWYSEGDFRIADIPSVDEAITKFIKLRNVDTFTGDTKLENYDSLHDLRYTMADYKNVDTRSKKEQAKDVTRFYKDEHISILIPHTETAACKYGANTRWCTSARENNQFAYYNGMAPLYIITTKDGDKYQFQFKSAGRYTFMDSNDEPVDMKQLIKELPSLKTAFNDVARKNGYVPLIVNPTNDEYLAALDKNPEIMQDIKNPSEEVQLEFVKRNPFFIRFVNNPTEKTQLAAVRNNGYAIEYITNPSEEVQLAAIDENKSAFLNIQNPTEAAKRAVRSD
jgi:hypothetical protein